MSNIIEKLSDPSYLIPTLIITLICGIIVRYFCRGLDKLLKVLSKRYRKHREKKDKMRDIHIELSSEYSTLLLLDAIEVVWDCVRVSTLYFLVGIGALVDIIYDVKDQEGSIALRVLLICLVFLTGMVTVSYMTHLKDFLKARGLYMKKGAERAKKEYEQGKENE